MQPEVKNGNNEILPVRDLEKMLKFKKKGCLERQSIRGSRSVCFKGASDRADDGQIPRATGGLVTWASSIGVEVMYGPKNA